MDDMGDFEKFYNKALRFLSFRPRSEKEVRDNLKKKSSFATHFAKVFNPDASDRRALRFKQASEGQERKRREGTIDLVINKLKEQNFINDLDFAKWWVEQRTNFKPRALRLIKMELKQKGINNELIEKMIYDLRLMNYVDLELAKKLAEKRVKRYKNLSKKEIYQKLGSFLARRGFDYETIKQVIDDIFEKEYNHSSRR